MGEQEISQIPTASLQPNPLQPRGSIDENSLEELKKSIEIHGIIEPLVVARTPAGYQIVAGERRWRAARSIGLKTVPVIIKKVTPRQMLELAIIENLQRKDLNSIEKAKAFKKLKEEFGFSTKEIAERMGKSVPYVVNTVRLLSLPDALKDGLLTRLISEGHARALAGINDTRLTIEAYKQVLKENASVRRAEEIARKIKEETRRESTQVATKPTPSKKEIEELAQKIEKKLNINSLSVKIHQSKVMTRVEFRLRGKKEKSSRLIEKIKEKFS